jgi:hypothetical protein
VKILTGNETETVGKSTTKGASVVTWYAQAQKAGQFRVEVRSSDGAAAAQSITIADFPQPRNDKK